MSADTPVPAATDTELAVAVQENLFAFFRAMRAVPGYESVENERLSHHHAFPTNPLFKGIWRARLAPGETDAAIGRALAWFKARRSPYALWWTGPDDQPADLPERLKASGFKESTWGGPGMVIDLHKIDDAAGLPEGFTFKQATSQQDLEDWRDAFLAAYGDPPFVGQAWVDASLAVGSVKAPWKLFVGYLDGEPVATSLLFSGAGVVGIYGIGTARKARRRGIGTAIMNRPLLEARAQGYRYGVGFATEAGYPMYRRLGCREVPCRIGRYFWWNE